MKTRRVLGERRVGWNWLVARKHAPMEEAVAVGVRGELIVAVQIPVANALLEPIDDGRSLAELDDAPHLDAGTESKFDACDDPEQAVPADRQAEQLRIF